MKSCSASDRIAHCRNLCTEDLYFLLRYALGRRDLEHPWLFARCREVEEAPYGYLDLWAREHRKSTIITQGKTIQNILRDPETTVGIFSHTRPNAKGFLRQIKREFEANERLREWFPDILWGNPERESPKWSEDDGIIVKRKTNPKESTVEAWGLVDGQPIGKHFKECVYDDVVTPASVTNPDRIAETTDKWALSLSLGVDGGSVRYAGTFYHFNDTYREILKRGAARPRIYPATADGTETGEPVLLSRAVLAEKRRNMGPYIYGCQMLLNPTADRTQGFSVEWLRYYEPLADAADMNKYILVDAASSKKKTSDRTVMAVVGLGADENYYLLDLVRDRLSLTQRADALFALHRKWKPISVGYEIYGLQADAEYVRERMGKINYHFNLIELGGQTPKPDRIKRLMPIFEQGRFWLPPALMKTDVLGIPHDVVGEFLEEEYKAFPVGQHDDTMDALARIRDEDMSLQWPQIVEDDRYSRAKANGAGSWMSV